MAQIIPIGQPVNDGERLAIAYLRDKLAADYRVAHNFELRHPDGQWFEIDVAVIAPHAVYVVDVKSTYGEIHVAGGKWHPEGRAPFPSPVGKLRFHARCLHRLLTGQPERRELKAIWVEPVVLLTAADAHIVDPSQRDRDCVVPLAGCERFFQDAARLPHQPPARTIRQYCDDIWHVKPVPVE